jgi:hypothetical protein
MYQSIPEVPFLLISGLNSVRMSDLSREVYMTPV